jgi:uncharacterized repeat protein (TIGR01451 family)
VKVDRFAGGVAGTVVLAVAGVLAPSAPLLVAAAVPVAYVVYGSLSGAPDEGLRAERTLSPTTALPGDPVTVRTTLTNDAGRTLSDLRVVDGVPESVAVLSGSPRAATSLRPGESTTVEYVVAARRGEFDFDSPRVRVRGFAATRPSTRSIEVDGDRTLTCRPDVETPLGRQTASVVGPVGTDDGGSGVEFHSTREYRRGDPVNRVDWRRLARDGDLVTVDFREHRSARVLLVVDARPPARVVPEPGLPTASATCAHAARRALADLLSEGHRVGAATLEPSPTVVRPGRGEELRLRVESLLDEAADADDEPTPAVRPVTYPVDRLASDGTPVEAPGDEPPAGDHAADGGRASAGPDPEHPPGRTDRPTDGAGRPPGTADRPGDEREARADDATDGVDRVLGAVDPSTQVVVFTPALDRRPVELARRAVARGHGVSVVSPDPVGDDPDTGGRLRGVQRRLFLDDLRAAGADVVDWQRDRPLALAVAAATGGRR